MRYQHEPEPLWVHLINPETLKALCGSASREFGGMAVLEEWICPECKALKS